MLDTFIVSQPFQDLLFFVVKLRRDNYGDRASNRLLRRESKNTHSCLVPTGDYAIQVFRDDGVIGGFDNRGKSKSCLLDSFALRDVFNHRDEMPELVNLSAH